MPLDWLRYPDFESNFGSNSESGSDSKEQIAEGVQRFHELDQIWLIGRNIPKHDPKLDGLTKSQYEWFEEYAKELRREILVGMAGILSDSFRKEQERTSSCRVPSIVIFGNMYDAV
jgi:hypothetical protein